MRYLLMTIILINIGFVSALSYGMNWDSGEIINGNEFNVVVNIDGEELYDGKLWIEDNGKIISERHDSKNDQWKSSYYYLNEYFGSGENKVKLRINEKYSDFYGSAVIHFRVRNEEEVNNSIEIIKKKLDSDNSDKDNQSSENSEEVESTVVETKNNTEEVIEENYSEPIVLGSKIDIVEEKDINSDTIVYESKGTRIVGYSVYGFALLCVALCVLIIWRKLK